MRFARVMILVLLGVFLLAGCSSEKTQKTDKADRAEAMVPGITIGYTLVVSGFPMMEEMTFNYEFATDGQIGKMASESIIPAADKVRSQKNSQITDIENRIQTFTNDVTRTYSSISLPDPSTVPPATGPEAIVSAELTGNVSEILGVTCRELGITVEVSRLGTGGTTTTNLAGTLWVSNEFGGFDLYDSFQKKMQAAMGQTRTQGCGYFEFLTHAGFSRDNLNRLYEAINGFPFAGSFELILNKGSDNPTTITTAIDVRRISADPIATSVFAVPEDYTEVELGQVNRPQGN